METKIVKSDESATSYFGILLLALAFVAIFYVVAFGYIIYWFVQAGDDAEKIAAIGIFGDSFGVVNAFFSAAAFAFIAVGLLIQMRDMRLSLDEFTKTTLAQQVTADMQRKSTLVQAMALHAELAKTTEFEARDVIFDVLERQRAFRTFEFRSHLESVILDVQVEAAKSGGLPPSAELRGTEAELMRRKASAVQLLDIVDSLAEFCPMELPSTAVEFATNWEKVERLLQQTRRALDEHVAENRKGWLLPTVETATKEATEITFESLQKQKLHEYATETNPKFNGLNRTLRQLGKSLTVEAMHLLGLECKIAGPIRGITILGDTTW